MALSDKRIQEIRNEASCCDDPEFAHLLVNIIDEINWELKYLENKISGLQDDMWEMRDE